MKKNLLLVSMTLFALALILPACSDDDGGTAGTDKMLFEMAKSTSGFTWFENSDANLPKSSGTGHSEPLLRTRYNSPAATMLDGDGRIKDGITFPDGSLIVKELLNSNGSIGRYAILYKQSDHPDADADGWVWGYIAGDGSVTEPAVNKGAGCRGCHGQAGHIDFNLMNKFF
ncbi:MAG: hypothetical protein IPN76_09715 [Saprospiraceae bacterium]|nr:hypothetical protein [Saprospiraceae bacterium]